MGIPSRRVIGLEAEPSDSLRDFISVSEGNDFTSTYQKTKEEASIDVGKEIETFDAINRTLGGDLVKEKLKLSVLSTGALDNLKSSEKDTAINKISKSIASKIGPSGSTIATRYLSAALFDECAFNYGLGFNFDASIIASLLGLDICNNAAITSALNRFSDTMGVAAVEQSVGDIMKGVNNKNASGLLDDIMANSGTIDIKNNVPNASQSMVDVINKSNIATGRTNDSAYDTVTNTMGLTSDNWLTDSLGGINLTNISNSDVIGSVATNKGLGRSTTDPSTFINLGVQQARPVDTTDYLSVGSSIAKWK